MHAGAQRGSGRPLMPVVPGWGHSYNDAGVSRLEYPILSAKPKLLFVGESQPRQQQLLDELQGAFEVVQVQSPLRALSRLARIVRRPVCRRRAPGRRVPDRAIAAKRADSRRHARRHRRARRRKHDHLGQRPAARMDGPRVGGRLATSTPCWAAPRFWAPTFAPSTRPWRPASPAPRRCAAGDNRYFQVHAAPVFEGDQRAAASDRHRPRRDDRDAAAAEAGGHPPGRHGAGRPDARRTVGACRSTTASSC